MKRQPCSTNRISKIKRIPYRITKKLGGGHKVNRRSTEENKEAVQQEKKEFLRIKGWRQHVAGKQKYPFEQTLKEVRPEKI